MQVVSLCGCLHPFPALVEYAPRPEYDYEWVGPHQLNLRLEHRDQVGQGVIHARWEAGWQDQTGAQPTAHPQASTPDFFRKDFVPVWHCGQVRVMVTAIKVKSSMAAGSRRPSQLAPKTWSVWKMCRLRFFSLRLLNDEASYASARPCARP